MADVQQYIDECHRLKDEIRRKDTEIAALKARLVLAESLAEAVEGIKPSVLYKRKPQDYVHMTDCEKMNAVAVALNNYRGVVHTWWPLTGGGE